MQINLSPDVAAALAREAERQGRTPDDVGNEIIREALSNATKIETTESTEGGSLFDLLGDLIGCLDSASDPEARHLGGARMSQDTRRTFAEGMMRKRQQGHL